MSATATRISTAGAEDVKDKAPAAPEANAKTISINPTLVLDDISCKEGSTGNSKPKAVDRTMTIASQKREF